MNGQGCAQHTLRHGACLIAPFSYALCAATALPFSRPLSLCHPLHAPSQLRLLYEAIPMAYLVEKAGGRSSDGRGSLLDIAVVDLDDRTQVPYHT